MNNNTLANNIANAIQERWHIIANLDGRGYIKGEATHQQLVEIIQQEIEELQVIEQGFAKVEKNKPVRGHPFDPATNMMTFGSP